MYALVDYYRTQTGLPWVPGGVAVSGPSGALLVRYDPDEVAAPALTRFRAQVAMIQAAINGGMDPLEAMARSTQSGLSGYLSWQVIVDVPDDASPTAIYNHYIEAVSQSPFPGSTPVDIDDLVTD